MAWFGLVSIVFSVVLLLCFILFCSILPGEVLLAWFGLISFGCLVGLGQISPTP